MSTITALNAILTADTAGFTSGIGKAKGGLTDLKAVAAGVFTQTRTPLEQYQTRLGALSGMLKRGQLDHQTYGRAVKTLTTELRSAQAAGNDWTAVGARLSQSLSALASPMGMLAAGAATIAALGTAAAATGVYAVKLAADFEQTKVAFTTMLGSAATAESTLASLSNFAAETPFEFPELADAAKKLAAFGVSADQLVPSLRALGDVSAGISQPIGEIAEIYGKVRTQGRLYGDDIKQLGGRGIPIIAELAKQFGVTEGQVSKLVEKGQVGFDNLQRAFVSLTAEGGRFHGMMDAQSETLLGLGSTLKDNVNLALRDFGTALTENFQLKEITKELIDFTGRLREAAPEIAQMTAKYAKMATTLANIATLGIFSGGGEKDGRGAELDAKIAEMRKKLGDTGLAEGETKGLKIEQRGPDTTAADKARADFDRFTADMESKLNSIGLDAAESKLQHFLDLAADGKVTLDTSDIDEARQKLAALGQAKTLKAVSDLEAELRKQIATMGQAANAAKFYELAQDGATDATLATVRALDAEKQALDRQQKFKDDVRKRLGAIGTTAEDQKLQDFQAEGATPAEMESGRQMLAFVKQKEALQGVADEMQRVREGAKMFTAEMAMPFVRLYEHLDQLGEQLKAGKITQKEYDVAVRTGMADANRAVQLFSETRRPIEKFAADLNELERLYADGLIDEATFDRAAGKAQSSLDQKGKQSPAAIERGSTEAYSAILKASQSKSQEQIAAKQLTEQAKIRAELEKQNRLLERKGPQLQIREMPP